MTKRITIEQLDGGFTIEKYEPKPAGKDFDSHFKKSVAKEIDGVIEQSKSFFKPQKSKVARKRKG